MPSGGLRPRRNTRTIAPLKNPPPDIIVAFIRLAVTVIRRVGAGR